MRQEIGTDRACISSNTKTNRTRAADKSILRFANASYMARRLSTPTREKDVAGLKSVSREFFGLGA